MVTAPFEALLCDLDGVLRRWDPQGLDDLDRVCGLAAGTLAATAFAPARLQPAIIGVHTDEQWRAGIADDLAAVCGSVHRAQALVDAWSAARGQVDHAVAALLRAVRRYLPVVLVSNATTRLEADLDALGITTLVDQVVNSARVGVAKPDAHIYRIAAARAGVPVDRCLFVDDSAANIHTAQQLGMVTVHYQSAEQLRTALAPVLYPATTSLPRTHP